MLKTVLDQMSIWINPLWIILGSMFGLHGLWRTMSRSTIALYLFATLALATLSARSGLQQDSGRKTLETAREKFEKQQQAQQQAIFLEQQTFSRKQTAMADDLDRLAELERRNSAPAHVVAKILNVSEPEFQLINDSSVEAQNIYWQVVWWNLDTPTKQPLQIPSEVANFLKPLTMPLPNNLFSGRGINPKTGDRIFGYFAVDCANCGPSQMYWVYFRFQQQGWMSTVPPARPIDPSFIFNNLDTFKAQPNEQWLDQIAPLSARQTILATAR